MQKQKVECERCGFRGDAEEVHRDPKLNFDLCTDREACTLRVLLYVLTGVR